jgi:hypothetical protein
MTIFSVFLYRYTLTDFQLFLPSLFLQTIILFVKHSHFFYLAGKVKLGMLAPLALFNGAFDRQRDFYAHTLHVGLDFICRADRRHQLFFHQKYFQFIWSEVGKLGATKEYK